MPGWRGLSLLERVRWIQMVLPPLLALLVIVYQLGIARFVEARYGHLVHYSVEIGFYSLAGPVVTWLTLAWVRRRLEEKEKLERQVRRREQHLASITQASADAILSLDRNGRIDSWNNGAAQLFGYPAEEIIGQPLSRILPHADTLLERLRRDKVVQNFETPALTRQGRNITVELTHTLLGEAPDSLTSALILRDVTLRRERNAILEEERARIARDLHDSVAQVLYLLALKADVAASQVEQNPSQAREELREIGRRSRQVIREIRRTIFALRPLDWSKEGFLPALRRFVLDFAEQVNWQAIFHPDTDDLEVPERLQPTVFRLVQESLNNVAKHAGAGQVWVSLSRDEERSELRLTIQDNGRGIEADASRPSGLGIQQMRQRVALVGGEFSLTNRPGEGVVISARLPL